VRSGEICQPYEEVLKKIAALISEQQRGKGRLTPEGGVEKGNMSTRRATGEFHAEKEETQQTPLTELMRL